jgi:hypothetical protein
MAIPLIILCTTSEKSSTTMKTAAAIFSVIYFLIFVVAIYLAIRDMQFVPQTATKFWLIAAAILCPEVYILFHGLTSSAAGESFFGGVSMPGSLSAASSVMAEGMTPSLASSTGMM